MRGKKGMVLLLSQLLLVSITLSAPGYSAEKSPYKIGVNLELTGPWAEVAKTVKRTMVMEVERINARGGVDGHPLELVIEDNGFDLGRVAANITKFAKNKEIILVVGPFEDNLQATSRAIAEREEITNIIISPSNPMLRALKQRWSFNIAHNDIIVSQKLVDLCLARGHKKVLVFHASHPLAQSLAQYFKRFGEEKGIKVIISKDTHKPTDIDMTPQLIKLKPLIEKEKVNAFYAATAGPPGPIISKNLRALGINIPILGTMPSGLGLSLSWGERPWKGWSSLLERP